MESWNLAVEKPNFLPNVQYIGHKKWKRITAGEFQRPYNSKAEFMQIWWKYASLSAESARSLFTQSTG
jgi:hypothetical protein